MTPIDNQKLLSFGEHHNLPSEKSIKTAKAVMIAALVTLGIVLAGSAVFLALVFAAPVIILAIPTIGIAVVAGTTFLSTIGMLASVIVYLKHRNASIGAVNNLKAKMHFPDSSSLSSECQGLPLQDSMEGFQAKLKLIRAAEHNIIISGNYCGGKTFEGTLNLIKECLESKPALKVVILSSDNFIDPEHYTLINEIQTLYPERFETIITTSTWYAGNGLTITQNHTKGISIDYGRYCILGGSGLEDKYSAVTGLGDRCAKPNSQINQVSIGRKMASLFLPTRGFRDQDFLFHSPDNNGPGKKMYLEMLLLATRWDGWNHQTIFTDTPLDQVRSAPLKSLLKANIEKEEPQSINTTISSFGFTRLSTGTLRIFQQGPEQEFNPYENEILEKIHAARTRILISHMYFHPTAKVLQAMTEAVNRGVKLKLITNGNEKYSPRAHSVFGDRNRYNYWKLFESVHPSHRAHLEIYEFFPRKTTLHKKVIVVDDWVIAGSSNLGYKSLVTMSDHELNFAFENKEFATSTAAVIEQTEMEGVSSQNLPRKNGKKIKMDKKLNLLQLFKVINHRILAPFIG